MVGLQHVPHFAPARYVPPANPLNVDRVGGVHAGELHHEYAPAVVFELGKVGCTHCSCMHAVVVREIGLDYLQNGGGRNKLSKMQGFCRTIYWYFPFVAALT